MKAKTFKMRSSLLILIALVACVAGEEAKKLVCYFGSWAIYRPGNGNFEVANIDPTLCTHLIYAFVGLSDNGTVKVLDPWADLSEGKDGFNLFNQLRNKNPHLKTLVGIGGWNEGSVKYSKLVSSAESRTAFVEDAVAFVKKYNFNGLDFDWEYPNQRGGVVEDKNNFVILLKELRARFDKEGLLISAAVAAAQASASLSYNVPEVSKYLHFVNIMAYDFHGSWDLKTGNNAPLYPGYWENSTESLLNVKESIRYWIKNGAAPQKLILGVPLYGRTFTLDNPKITKIGAPASKPGVAGPYTREAGTMGYNEICESQKNSAWELHYNKYQEVPYAIKDSLWISYDNVLSLKKKVNFAKSWKLGGIMVWSIETDDFRGICGPKNILLKTLNEALFGCS